uniref:Ribonuclease H protein At1g65750 family n=1 Tax=Cajanus cajan TaxID=3821 RepID=A0A151SWM9_CAJCA|nr:Putative ribonuclease H protein At1g65750 family [Cajanus cajan]
MNDVIKEYDVGVLCLLETHINGRRAKQVASRIKLDGVHIVDTHGKAGDIWCLWDSKKWDLDIVTQSSQFIHIKVRRGDSQWFCTFVYASPHPQFCIDLWREFCSLASGIDRPWALMGYFNAVLKIFDIMINEEIKPKNLGKYLGIPLHHSRVNRATYSGIIEKVTQRLNNWKAKSLSFARRLTLTKSVLTALPSYTMQTIWLPRNICHDIDKKNRQFL